MLQGGFRVLILESPRLGRQRFTCVLPRFFTNPSFLWQKNTPSLNGAVMVVRFPFSNLLIRARPPCFGALPCFPTLPPVLVLRLHQFPPRCTHARPQGGARPLHHKSTCPNVINFRALCGANLVTPPPHSGVPKHSYSTEWLVKGRCGQKCVVKSRAALLPAEAGEYRKTTADPLSSYTSILGDI